MNEHIHKKERKIVCSLVCFFLIGSSHVWMDHFKVKLLPLYVVKKQKKNLFEKEFWHFQPESYGQWGPENCSRMNSVPMAIQLDKTTQCSGTGQAKVTTILLVSSSAFFLKAKSFRYKHWKALDNSARQVEKERKQCLYDY